MLSRYFFINTLLKLSMLFLLQKLCACEKVYADTHNNNKIYERDDGSNKQVSA